MKRLAVFASGAGSNALRLIEYFSRSEVAEVKVVITNNPVAGVIAGARSLNIPVEVLPGERFNQVILPLLEKYSIDWIVLAGFLKLVPPAVVHAYSGRIINLHPALLPKFGGPGMYGKQVHEAVIAARENMSGITIHLVNEEYDQGKIIFQQAIPVGPGDTALTLEEKIRNLEAEHFPVVVERAVAKG